MAKFTYTSNEGSILRFDSDPYRSLAMRYGYQLGTVRLEQTEANEARELYNVYAKRTMSAEHKVGTLESLTSRELWRRQV